MRIATWNLERKKPTSPRGAEALDYLYARDADVFVVTEARNTMPTSGGHMLFSPAPGSPWLAPDERKVALWSREEIEPVHFDIKIDESRFVAGRTETPIGSLLVVGVCITWHMAGVGERAGRVSKPWEQHLAYLENLAVIFASIDEPFVVAGDFNQRYPRVKGSNKAASQALADTFTGIEIVTAGIPDGCTKPGIDHIAVSAGLEAFDVAGWPNDATGNRMSDHDGSIASVRRSASRR